MLKHSPKDGNTHPVHSTDLKTITAPLRNAEAEVPLEHFDEPSKTRMIQALGPKLPKTAFITCHGPDCKDVGLRPDEPAQIINHSQYEDSQRDAETGVQIPCWVVKYHDGALKWIPQTIQQANFDRKPSWFKRDRVWCEMIPGTMITTRYAVKGRDMVERY